MFDLYGSFPWFQSYCLYIYLVKCTQKYSNSGPVFFTFGINISILDTKMADMITWKNKTVMQTNHGSEYHISVLRLNID